MLLYTARNQDYNLPLRAKMNQDLENKNLVPESKKEHRWKICLIPEKALRKQRKKMN